jgi:hypothetical protein
MAVVPSSRRLTELNFGRVAQPVNQFKKLKAVQIHVTAIDGTKHDQQRLTALSFSSLFRSTTISKSPKHLATNPLLIPLNLPSNLAWK